MSSPIRVRALGPGDVGTIGDRGVEDVVIVDTARGASSAFGLVASAMAPVVVVPSTGPHSGGRIALPLVERTTRYVVPLDFFYVVFVDGA